MSDSTPQATPQDLPLSIEETASATDVATATVRHRPSRGVRTLSLAAGSAFGSVATVVYASPVFPDGITAGALQGQPFEAQRELAGYWFRLNFVPANGAEGYPSRLADEMYVLTDDFGRKLVDDYGLGLAGSGAQAATIEEDPLAALQGEFNDSMSPEALNSVASTFRGVSPTWFFVPPPAPLAAAGSTDTLTLPAQGALVETFATALLALLSNQPIAERVPGKNYWDGAELLEELSALKASVAAIEREVGSFTPSPAVVEQEVGRLQKVTERLAGSLIEVAIKEAAKGIVLGVAAYIWREHLFYYVHELVYQAEHWLSLLPGG